ncbi:hypothetical protein V5O48_000916 [Marasmius crinis-equi]|uniref:DJ-1/PfpI domain-containing protein n=1 Tax=Marasmius crinis-equi TaxID=585013 RepID=A0ABR3FZY2_9AGAR
MSSSEVKILRLAVCLYPHCTTTDWQGPVEMLCIFNSTNRKLFGSFYKHLPNTAIEADFLSHNMDPVTPTQGAKVLPSMTYEEGLKTNFDILLIPGGPSPREGPPDIREFLKVKAPQTKYVLSVCTGSWQLAVAGLLEGKRATTNKAWYKVIVEDTKDLNITWVPKARWVVNDDKHIWTSSGVTAGIDLAYAFLIHLFGEPFADEVKGLVEFSTSKDSEDDEFAVYYGLA